MTLVPFALLGSKAMYLLFAWLLASIAAGYIAERKGYPERLGIGAGLLLTVIGPILWLVVPARDGSLWKRFGPWGTRPRSGTTDA